MSVIKVVTARNTIVPHVPQLSSETEVSSASYVQLANSSTNQELFEKHLCNQGSHYKEYGEWNTKEDTG